MPSLNLGCPKRVSHPFPNVEGFNHLGFLFANEGGIKQEINKQIGVASEAFCTSMLL